MLVKGPLDMHVVLIHVFTDMADYIYTVAEVRWEIEYLGPVSI